MYAQEMRGKLILGDGQPIEVVGIVAWRRDSADWRCLFPELPAAGQINVGETYRLELDDGRTGQVVVFRINHPEGHVEAIGQGPLVSRPASP